MPFLLPLLAGGVAGSGLYYALNASIQTRTGYIVLSLHDIAQDLKDAIPPPSGRESKIHIKEKTRRERQREELARLRKESANYLALGSAVKESWNRHLLWVSLTTSKFFNQTDWQNVGWGALAQGQKLAGSVKEAAADEGSK